MSAPIEVRGRDQLAAAVRAVPHDVPTIIVVHRNGKKPLLYKFDYSKGDKINATVGPQGTQSNTTNVLKTTESIDARLARIARNIMKLPKELYE